MQLSCNTYLLHGKSEACEMPLTPLPRRFSWISSACICTLIFSDTRRFCSIIHCRSVLSVLIMCHQKVPGSLQPSQPLLLYKHINK